MRKVLFVIIISIFLNLLILSIGHGQSNVNIGGIVPETDYNRNSLRQQIKLKDQNPPTGENKYLYFFEKTLGLQAETEKNADVPAVEPQTIYDQVSSSLLLWLIMMFVAVMVLIILKVIDKYIMPLLKLAHRRVKRHNYA